MKTLNLNQMENVQGGRIKENLGCAISVIGFGLSPYELFEKYNDNLF